MSLATRCPTCATSFRVAQDQLKASEGWVRCGQCETVFNALEGLFDLERDAPSEVATMVPVGTAAPTSNEPGTAPTGHDDKAERSDERDAEMSQPGARVADPGDAEAAHGPGEPFDDSHNGGAVDGHGEAFDDSSEAEAAHGRREPFDDPPRADPAHGEPFDDSHRADPAHDCGKPFDDSHHADLAYGRGEPFGDSHDAKVAHGHGDSFDDARDADVPSRRADLLADPIDAHLFGPRRRADSAPKPAGPLAPRDHGEFSDARFDSDLFPENAAQEEGDLVMPATDVTALPLESQAQPEFLRRAERRGRRRGAPSRRVLAIAATMLAVVLAAQLVNHFHDGAASRWPALKPALEAWCQLAECSIAAPRRIEQIAVESSGLTRAAAPDAFLLAVNLRSTSGVAVALPSIELSLTDANGRLIARRALAPSDFGAADVIAPGVETALQLVVGTSPAVVGYTVEIFYP